VHRHSRTFARARRFYADGALFSGDLLFPVGRRTDLPGGTDTLVAPSAHLRRYPPETVVYRVTEGRTTLAAELAHNPFLAELRA